MSIHEGVNAMSMSTIINELEQISDVFGASQVVWAHA